MEFLGLGKLFIYSFEEGGEFTLNDTFNLI